MEFFTKNTRGSRRSSPRKCPVTERSSQKELQDIVEVQSPRARTFGAKFYKSAGNKKTLRNEHNSGKKRDNFELRTKIVPREPRPKHSGVAESLPRPQLVIRPWRIYPSYGHRDDHFDDGYIRHMALNGLNSKRHVVVMLTTQSAIFEKRGLGLVITIFLTIIWLLSKEELTKSKTEHFTHNLCSKQDSGCIDSLPETARSPRSLPHSWKETTALTCRRNLLSTWKVKSAWHEIGVTLGAPLTKLSLHKLSMSYNTHTQTHRHTDRHTHTHTTHTHTHTPLLLSCGFCLSSYSWSGLAFGKRLCRSSHTLSDDLWWSISHNVVITGKDRHASVQIDLTPTSRKFLMTYHPPSCFSTFVMMACLQNDSSSSLAAW